MSRFAPYVALVFVIALAILTPMAVLASEAGIDAKPQTLMEQVVELIMVAAIGAAVQWVRERREHARKDEHASKLDRSVAIAVGLAEAFAARVDPGTQEKLKNQATALAVRAGVDPLLAERVIKVTKNAVKCLDEDGNMVADAILPPCEPAIVLRPKEPPRLGAWLLLGAVLALLAAAIGGCASPAMKESADKLRRSVRTMIASTEPRHEYDAAGRAGVDAVALKTIETADKLAGACGLPPLTPAEESAAYRGEQP